jgi:hypothetical protein
VRLLYVVVGVFALIFGVVMLVWPEKVARWRNSGAINSEPTPGLIKLTQYFGGPALVILGTLLVESAL